MSLLTLDGAGGRTLLAVCWGIAAAGIPFKIRWLDAPVWLSTGIYLAMGYLALLARRPHRPRGRSERAGLADRGRAGLHRRCGHLRPGASQSPSRRFGHHEIWHLLVLLGSGCHFGFVLLHVAMA